MSGSHDTQAALSSPPAMLLQEARKAKPLTPVFTVAEPLCTLALLALCTAFLVDGSFNPFLYFRF